MSVAREELLEIAAPEDHYVQLYGADSAMLAVNVGRYIFEGLVAGTPGVVIAAEENRDRILAELSTLGIDAQQAQGDGTLLVLDAHEMLSRFMVGGYPDATLFGTVVGQAVRTAIAGSKYGTLRAYGEMVGVLWSNGQYPAAIRLEQLWNTLRKETPFNLFCGYPIDVFAEQFNANVVTALLCAHTHLLPAGLNGKLEDALTRATDEVLGNKIRPLRPAPALPNEFADMPKAEAAILWVRANFPDQAEAILDRARAYYNGVGAA